MRSGVDVQRREAGDLDREVADELLELVGAGHEVGLAVDLDEHADAAAGVDVARDEALAGVAAGLLGGRREALLAQQRDGLVEVAVGLGQGALAVHEAGAGPLAQLLDQLRRDVRHAGACSCLSCGPCGGPPRVAGVDVLGAAGCRPRSPAGRAAGGRPRPSRPLRGRARRRSPRASPRGGGLGDGGLGPGDAVAGQQVVVVGVRLEGQRRAAGEGRDELVGGARDLVLGLGHRPSPRSASGSVALRAERSLGAFDRGVGDERAQQPDGADGVVVGRDDVVELVGVDVRVAGADDRDLELVGLGHARSARGAGRR